MDENTLFKGKMPQPPCSAPADPDAWWKPKPWQPGQPRAFTPQHNFGKTDQVNATNPKRFVTIHTKGE